MSTGAMDWTVTMIGVAFETVSGVRVGGERGGIATDLPVLRHVDGRPYIPGSSLKGVLRSAAERMLGDRVDPPVCSVLDAPCGGSPQDQNGPISEAALGALCWVCRFFGSPHRGGQLVVEDLLPDSDVATVVRDGVAIDRDEVRARDGMKFDYEVIAPGARLTGRLRVDDAADADLGVLASLLDLVDMGIVTIGGGASRGLGRLRYAEPPRAVAWRASSFRPGSRPEDVDLDGARTAASQLVEDGG